MAILVAAPNADADTDAPWRALVGTLAMFKLPELMARHSALPRNTTGNVQKTVLRAVYFDLFSN
ncbi:MAG: hypothetical protein WBH14_04550 [Albidovulum sp.]